MTGKQIDDSRPEAYDINVMTWEVHRELERARQLHPGFPADPIHQAAIVWEESGEALRAAIQSVYEDGPEAAVDGELLQTAAMCIRALVARRIQRGLKDEQA